MMNTPPIIQLKCGVLMQDRCMKGADHATYPSAEMWCSDAGKMLIMTPILQLKCGVLMRDRCMKGADHATYPSTIIRK